MASSVYLRSVSAGSRGEHEPQASGPEGDPQWSSDQGEGEQESEEHQGPTHENTEPPDPLRAGLGSCCFPKGIGGGDILVFLVARGGSRPPAPLIEVWT